MGIMTQKSEGKGPARPRQLTTAAVAAIVGSVVLVLSLVDTLGRLRTPETRASVDEFLSDGPGSGLSVDTAQVVDAMRLLVYVSGALAAVALVFAVFVLQRHQGARVGLSVAAGLLLLTIPVAGLMPLLIAFGAAMMWTRPARDWYAGREPAPARAASSPGLLSEPDERPSPWQPPAQQPPAQQPGPTDWPANGPTYPPPPSGQASYPPYDQPGYSPYNQPYGQPYGPGDQQSDKRPLTVTIAAVLTWVGSGLVLAGALLFAVALSVSRDMVVDEIERTAQDTQVALDVDDVLAVVWAGMAFFTIWALVAAVLAVFAFRRSNGARITLVISAVMTALVSLLVVATGVSLLWLVLGVAVVVLLFTGGANDWYARRGTGQRGGERPSPW